ncbi:MAG: hypothetical protein K6T85_18570, partial [Gorillibacterium sp.]|nr:hypothetical protein [Gorillibacterium sp.]
MRLLRVLLSLYPKVWRDRYEAELLELFSEKKTVTIADGIDLLRNALDAHLHLEWFSQEPTLFTSPYSRLKGCFIGILVLLFVGMMLATELMCFTIIAESVKRGHSSIVPWREFGSMAVFSLMKTMLVLVVLHTYHNHFYGERAVRILSGIIILGATVIVMMSFTVEASYYLTLR